MLLKNHLKNRKLIDHVENRTMYTLEAAELNIFETYKSAEKVSLQFEQPIIASMLTGKKILKVDERSAFEFLPGESVIVPAKGKLIIDFPDATMEKPTQCLALALDTCKIQETVSYFNEKTRYENKSLTLGVDDIAFHLVDETAIKKLIERLVYIFTEDHKSKEMFADFIIKELIIRILQSKSKVLLLNDNVLLSDNRLAYVIKYVRENLVKNLTVDALSEKACMSKPHFFRCFKNTFGQSPIDYVNSERIKYAKKLITENYKSLNDVSQQSGFNNMSYFIRQFKKQEKMTPSQYKKVIKNEGNK